MAVNSVTTSNVRWYNGNADGDGVGLGALSTSLVGFFGTTPIARPSVTAVVTTATTGTNEAAVTRLYTAMVNLGLIVTS